MTNRAAGFINSSQVKFFGCTCTFLLLALLSRAEPVQPALPSALTNRLVSNASTEMPALRQRANDLYDSKQYALAIKLSNELLAKDTNDAVLTWQLASSFYYVSNLEAAAQVYARYTKLEPQIPEGHLWLGICLRKLKRLDAAEPELRKAIRLNPKNPLPYDELGYCLKRESRYAEAAREFEAAVKVDGDAAYRYLQSGYCYRMADNDRAAIPMLERGLALEKTNAYGWDRLGDCYYCTHDYDKAATAYAQALRIQPTRFYAQKWLGYTYLSQKKYEQAVDAFAKAIKLKPGDEIMEGDYGTLLLRRNRLADAIKILEPLQKSTNTWIRRSLFSAYFLHNDYKKAARLYPSAFTIGAILIGVGFVIGSVLLIRKSFQPSTAEYPHWAFVIGWFLLYFESQVAMIFYAGFFTHSKLAAGLIVAPIPLLVAAFVAFPHKQWGRPFLPPASIRPKQIAIAVIAWIGSLMLSGAYVGVLTNFTHYRPEPRNIKFVLEIVQEHRTLAAVVVVFLAPICEEILFRGLLFGALRKWLNPAWTIVITAICFAAIHMDIYYLVPLFLLGMVLGWARNSANSIWFSTALHVAQNGLAFAALTFSKG